jgi:hypothetical protein
VVAHSFAEESVTEGSGGERDANVAIDPIGDVISHVKESNRKPKADLRIESSSERSRAIQEKRKTVRPRCLINWTRSLPEGSRNDLTPQLPSGEANSFPLQYLRFPVY